MHSLSGHRKAKLYPPQSPSSLTDILHPFAMARIRHAQARLLGCFSRVSIRNCKAAHPGDASSLANFLVLLFAGAAACAATRAPAFLDCGFLAGAAADSAALSVPVREYQESSLIMVLSGLLLPAAGIATSSSGFIASCAEALRLAPRQCPDACKSVQ